MTHPSGQGDEDRELVERLRGLLDNATSTPWKHRPVNDGYERVRDAIAAENGRWEITDDIAHEGDAILIVEAINALPKLLDALESSFARETPPTDEGLREALEWIAYRQRELYANPHEWGLALRERASAALKESGK